MVLNVDGLAFGVVDGPNGPLLEETSDDWGAVAAVLNYVVQAPPYLEDFLERLDAGEPMASPVAYVVPAAPGDAGEELRARWRERTGTEMGDDLWRVGMDGGGWLPHESLVPRRVLRGLWERLRALRLGSAGTWLFRRHPVAERPADGEEERLRALEARVSASAARGGVADEALLGEMDAAGILDPARAADKARWLEGWGAGVLAGYLAAAVELGHYLRSPARQGFLGGRAWNGETRSSPVSVEVFRRGDLAFSSDPWELLARVEGALDAAEGEEGEAEVAAEDGTRARARWRRGREGRPVVTSVAPAGQTGEAS